MGRWIAAAMLVMSLLSQPALAYDPTERAQLDMLFAALSKAATPREARLIDTQIWAIWVNPTDPEIARRMDEIEQVRQRGDLDAVLAMLDDIVADFPDYAEGWNQRATIEFVMGDDEASLADIDEVLKREPRHFGALSGQALIFNRQGRRNLAVEAMRKALAIHPFLVEKSEYPELNSIRA